jgi:Endonuclease/Exonuclease/phosphatase family
LEFIVNVSPSIVCLQEFWVVDPDFSGLYKSALATAPTSTSTNDVDTKLQQFDSYKIESLKRTQRKNDGVAIAYKTADWKIVKRYDVPFDMPGQRVALALHLKRRSPFDHEHSEPEPEAGTATATASEAEAGAAVGVENDQTQTSSGNESNDRIASDELLVVTTHLTFPHHCYDRKLRQRQIIALVDKLDALILSDGLRNLPVVVAGDFNGDSQDPTFKHMVDHGYRSAFHLFHGRGPGVTHRNHNQDDVAVDFIFVRRHSLHLEKGTTQHNLRKVASAAVVEDLIHGSTVEPTKYCDSTWPTTDVYELSDHRPVTATLSLPCRKSSL